MFDQPSKWSATWLLAVAAGEDEMAPSGDGYERETNWTGRERSHG